jgi:hypothetical protein
MKTGRTGTRMRNNSRVFARYIEQYGLEIFGRAALLRQKRVAGGLSGGDLLKPPSGRARSHTVLVALLFEPPHPRSRRGSKVRRPGSRWTVSKCPVSTALLAGSRCGSPAQYIRSSNYPAPRIRKIRRNKVRNCPAVGPFVLKEGSAEAPPLRPPSHVARRSHAPPPPPKFP